jgi:DNA polymerase-4
MLGMLIPPSDTGVGWLLLDLNSYFASVEQQLNPRLRGRPIAVVPMPTDGTCAIAASYEAKAYGIKTGTKIYEAKQMCPDLVCVLAQHDVYVKYHHLVIEEMARHTPINKVWSIDEMNSRLTLKHRTRTAAIDLGHRIKKGLRENVGECIKASIGIATNSFLAKTASDMQKPDGLVVLEGHVLPGPLLDLELTDLCGIGPNMEKRLNTAGIWTMKQLWETTPKQLRALWNSVEGEKFWYRLHGYDLPDPVEGDKVVIGHSRVLDADSRKPDVACDVARRLTTKACQRLRRYNLYANGFSLSVRTTDGRRWGGECPVHPANDSLTFVRLTHRLWAQMMACVQPYEIKKISMSLNGLQTTAQTTGDLFETMQPVLRRNEQRRSNALSAAMDEIARDFGPHAVHFGNQPQTVAGFVGTKIAFARVPDIEEFME